METINDIVQEIRSVVANKTMGKMTPKMREYEKFIKGTIREWPDRIEKAIEPTIIAAHVEAIIRNGVPLYKFKEVIMERSKLQDENDRLKAALKAVLEVDMAKFGDEVGYGDFYEAVRNAQRIYREGEVK